VVIKSKNILSLVLNLCTTRRSICICANVYISRFFHPSGSFPSALAPRNAQIQTLDHGSHHPNNKNSSSSMSASRSSTMIPAFSSANNNSYHDSHVLNMPLLDPRRQIQTTLPPQLAPVLLGFRTVIRTVLPPILSMMFLGAYTTNNTMYPPLLATILLGTPLGIPLIPHTANVVAQLVH